MIKGRLVAYTNILKYQMARSCDAALSPVSPCTPLLEVVEWVKVKPLPASQHWASQPTSIFAAKEVKCEKFLAGVSKSAENSETFAPRLILMSRSYGPYFLLLSVSVSVQLALLLSIITFLSLSPSISFYFSPCPITNILLFFAFNLSSFTYSLLFFLTSS